MNPATSLRGRWLLCLGAALVLGSTLWRLRSVAPVRPTAPVLPQDPYIQVYFNRSEANVYTEPYRSITRQGDDLEQVIVTAIDQASTSVDVAVQALNLPRVTSALVAAARRGIAVRVILENQYADPNKNQADPEQPAFAAAIAQLQAAGIPQIDDTADGSKGSGLMHHKFVVIDRRWVVTGSANFTFSGVHGDRDEPESRGNANVLLKIDSPALAEYFTAEFALMWGDGPGGQTDSRFGLQKPDRPAASVSLPTGPITLQFSPRSTKDPWEQSTNGLIARSLATANSTVDLALFVFSEQRLANQLEIQVRGGAALRALIDPGFAYRSYSEVLDILGIVLPDNRCRIEKNNHPWTVPLTTVGTPQLPPGDKLHHKFAIVDGRRVIVGSHNWSDAANHQNDETLLVIDNPTVAAHFTQEFERLYREPQLGYTPALGRKIEEMQQRCQIR